MNLSPFFCPKCPEIRGTELNTGTLLTKQNELYFNSFGMCLECKEYLATHSQEEIDNNKKSFLEKIDKAIKENMHSIADNDVYYTVYYIEDTHLYTLLEFINCLITPYRFSSIVETIDSQTVRKLTTPIKQENLEFITNFLKKHNIRYIVKKL